MDNTHCIDNINSNIFVLELAQRLSELPLTVTLLRYYLSMLQKSKTKTQVEKRKSRCNGPNSFGPAKRLSCTVTAAKTTVFFVLFFFIYYYYIATTGAAFNCTNEGAPKCIMCCGKPSCVRVFDIFVETTSE